MQQPPYQPSQARPAPKKSGNGCIIALAVVGGLVLLTVATVAFGIYRFAGSKEGKAVFGMLGDMTKLMAEAQSAPGAEEVRALGSDQAMVLDMEKMGSVFEHLDAGVPKGGWSVMVMCQVGVLGTPPRCDDVARTYVGAAKAPPAGLAVTVTHAASQAGACSALYDAKGTRLRDLAPGSTPRFPGK